MPPEVHPRRRPAHPLLRIIVAVLSGAAAMSAISSYQDSPRKPPAVPAPVAARPAPQEPPKPEQPRLDMPKAGRTPEPPPAASSMMIKPEPRLAPRGVLRGSNLPRLKSRSWSNEFSKVDSEGITRGFSGVSFQAPELQRDAAVVAPTRPRAKKGPVPREDEFLPSSLHPEILPEEAFWTQDRLLRVGGAALLALLGLLYIAKTAFPGKKPDEAP